MGMGMGMGLALIVAMTTVIALSEGQTEAKFKCSSSGQNATCRSLLEYKTTNATTLRHIQSLFNVKHLLDILGANNLPSNTPGNYRVGPNQPIKVPFPCNCQNGTGLSNHVPVYKIKGGDTLFNIATIEFGGLVKFPQIASANNLSNPNNITAGDNLWIPLPCSCDQVAGFPVVHYTYLVESGSTLETIAETYGTTQQILLSLNGITNPKTLQAGQVLDVPLQACSSSVKSDSLDYPLLVANATYTYTANECVKCKCDSSNNFLLQCEPSLVKPTNWSVCPSTECSPNVLIGNTTSSDSCNRTTCDYTGYSSHNISTALLTHDTCAVSPNGSSSGSGSGASRSILQGLVWNNLFIVIHLVLFLVYIL